MEKIDDTATQYFFNVTCGIRAGQELELRIISTDIVKIGN